MLRRRFRNLALVCLLPAVVAPLGSSDWALAQSAAVQVSDDLWSSLQYRYVGPIGNRVSAVVGIPGDANSYLAGAASGGVFKTTDGGVNWRPVFDDQPVQAIGSLAVAASDPNVVWAGTGESFIRSNVVVGNGVYKSVDSGETWKHMGLPDSGRVGRIVIHPTDPDTVWVAALGHLYGPQPDRGIYKTTDGGMTWEQVLFVDENTGGIDLILDPSNPRIVYAAMWQMEIWTWGRESGGPGSGIHKSVDGGDNWTELTDGGASGLPRGPLGKIGLAISAANPSRVYALIETSSFSEFAPTDDVGVLWRSEDRGESWRLVSRNHTLTQRPLYYTRAVAAPDDDNEIHFMAVSHTRSHDGGVSVESGGAGGDNHDMWIDPLLPDRMIVGHDGGISISTNRGDSWFRPYLPIAQMYHVTTDNRVPYFLYGNRQDGSSFRGPSNSLSRGSIPSSAWHSIGGCESGWAVPDPVDDNIIWSGCYDSLLDRYDLRTGHAQNVSVWPSNPEGWAAADLKYRFQWTFPIAISPHDHNVVYVGSQFVHRTDDAGFSWTEISPDLTTNDPELQQKTGGLTPDDSSPTYAAVLFAIAESPVERGVIWAGSNDGLLHVTRDGGASWTDVTANMPGLPPLGTMSALEPSSHEAGTAYVAVDMHQVNSTEPQLYRTRDYGASWSRIVDGIPPGPLSYTHVIQEDPVRPGLLYAGTGNALYVSFDDGQLWHPLQTNLPHAPVHWLTIQEQFNDLVVATYGRGFWILDDITPLQQMTDEALAADLWFFAPRPAYRFKPIQSHVTARHDDAAGRNPAYGASLNYFVSPNADVSGLSLDVIDEAGDVVRTLRRLPSDPGINRAQWDLRMEASRTPRLRTQPLEHAHAEFDDQGTRGLTDGGRLAPLAPPGTYTLRLRSGDTTIDRSVEVLKDPKSTGTLADIAEQTRLTLAIRGALDEVVDVIEEIEWLRHQVDEVENRARDRRLSGVEDALEAVAALDADLIDVENTLFDLRLTGGTSFQDSLRWPRQLYAKLASLGRYVAGTDFAPTSQQVEVFGTFQEQLAATQQKMTALREQASHANELLREAGIGVLGVGS